MDRNSARAKQIPMAKLLYSVSLILLVGCLAPVSVLWEAEPGAEKPENRIDDPGNTEQAPEGTGQPADSASIPSLLSYRSICCMLDELQKGGVDLTFETNHIEQLADSTIQTWKDRTFLFMRGDNAGRMFTVALDEPSRWLEELPLKGGVTIEFQQMKIKDRRFLISLYATSPVTRALAVWTEKGDYLFSTQGDVLAIEEPAWNRKNYRIYFWNPTGSDLAIVEYDYEANKFLPILAVHNSGGTFSDGSEDHPRVPAIRTEYRAPSRLRVMDHFSEYRREKEFLPRATTFWHLGSREDIHLIGYREELPELEPEKLKFQPESFFRNKLFTTGWIEGELPD